MAWEWVQWYAKGWKPGAAVAARRSAPRLSDP